MAERHPIKPVMLTSHAATVLVERNIPSQWIDRTLNEPDWTEPDPSDPSLTRAYRSITEFDDRILRVVYREDEMVRRVITVFFDRTRGQATRKGPP